MENLLFLGVPILKHFRVSISFDDNEFYTKTFEIYIQCVVKFFEQYSLYWLLPWYFIAQKPTWMICSSYIFFVLRTL